MSKNFIPSTKSFDYGGDESNAISYQQCNKCPNLSFREPTCKILHSKDDRYRLSTYTASDGFISIIRPINCPKDFDNNNE